MQDMFLGIANAAPVGVLAISRDGGIRFTNPALCRIFGYAESTLIGLPVETLLPETAQSGHRHLRQSFFASPSSRGMGEGRTLFGRHATGRLIPVEIGLGSTGEGDEALAVAFISDLSHKKLSEERFTAIVNALPAGLVLTNADGTIVMTNPTLDEMFGYPADVLHGQPIEVLLPTRSRAGHPALRASYMRAPEKRTMGAGRDLMALHSSGKEFPVEVALTPMTHADKTGTLAVVTDISVRKKLEHALLQANANLDEFTYIASHDLRTPLRGISDLLEWIYEDLPPAAMNDSITKNFDRARQRIARTERMIEDLLLYARASAREYRTELTSPRRLIEEILELTPVPPGFTVSIDATDQNFTTHKTPLQTGLRNLLDNAIRHHGGQSGRISFTVREEGRYFIFTVDDDGASIPESSRDKIFKLFHRASGTSAGHGIGLSVTRRMITGHGGTLVLEAESPLGGACFSIFWPRFEMKEED